MPDIDVAREASAASMTPEAIMRALQAPGPRPLPLAELEAAGEAREAMVPLFLAHIDRLTGAGLDAADDPAFIFVYHLLAEWGETRAYRPLLRLLRGDPEFVDALMGDGITESGARVVVRLFDGDLGPILEAALDSEAEEYVRGQMLDALAMLAGENAPLRPAVADFLRSFPAAVAPEMTPDIVWLAWADAIADLGLADMTPAVRRVYDDGLIDPMLGSIEEFEESLAKTMRTGEPAWHGRRGPIVDAIAELSGWYCFSEAYLRDEAKRARRQEAEPFGGELPFIRADAKVGRNDPCPCGSGKKFKKCCLGLT